MKFLVAGVVVLASDRPSEVSQTPPKWVLDNAGVIGQHVGERVQGGWRVRLGH
jgi:hypothetical protein